MVLTDAGRKRLATILIVQEVSQRRLAKAAGWRSHSYMTRLMRGEENTLSTDAAARIAAYLGVGMDALFVPRTSGGTAHAARDRRTADAA